MNICLFGASSPDLEQKYYDAAALLGEKMAERGHRLVFGGGEQGLMGACVKALEAHGGEYIGVSPRFFDIPGILHKGSGELIFTDTMDERKNIMEDKADCFVVVPGGVGTFEEFFETFTLKQLGQLNKPIALLDVDGYFDILVDMLDMMIEKGFMKKECADIYGVFDDCDELLDYVENVKEEPGDIYKLKLG